MGFLLFYFNVVHPWPKSSFKTFPITSQIPSSLFAINLHCHLQPQTNTQFFIYKSVFSGYFTQTESYNVWLLSLCIIIYRFIHLSLQFKLVSSSERKWMRHTPIPFIIRVSLFPVPFPFKSQIITKFTLVLRYWMNQIFFFFP